MSRLPGHTYHTWDALCARPVKSNQELAQAYFQLAERAFSQNDRARGELYAGFAADYLNKANNGERR